MTGEDSKKPGQLTKKSVQFSADLIFGKYVK